ncbi:MAG: DinB family protein [Chitinophagaceae bacterium]|nr:DinB family protein [Chitinophagaceae bacterium]
MIVQALLGEFLHEAENTRKLLNAIPDSALDYKPSEKNWTTGQLASHIAEVYNWFDPTFNQDVMEMTEYKYDKGDITKAANIVAKFEENVKKAQAVLENAKDDTMMNMWAMHFNGQIGGFPPMPRITVVRGFLFNHLYHHRGELVVYLRATGNKVPGLYGPTADDVNMG